MLNYFHYLKNVPKKIAKLKWDPDVMDVIPYDHIMGLDE